MIENMQTMTQQISSESSLHTSPSSLKVDLVSADDLTTILQQDDVLMVVNFSSETKIDIDDPRLVSVGLETLGNSASVEVWRGSGPVTCHRKGRICWSENSDFLFGHLMVDESASNNLDELIESAYTEIRTFLNSSSHPHAFRIWNYIPSINQVENGIERYQSFCVGRHKALSPQPDFEQTLPAASAVGTGAPGLLISFVSGKIIPVQVENPRQVSAFNYPPVHGPRSPLFSRAACINWKDNEEHQLYISGTASIVGHETQHAGDITAQAEETCRNIDAVLGSFSHYMNRANTNYISGTSLRVYLRHPEQLESVRKILSRNPKLPENIIYLKGDICRAGLLLEMEGIFN